VIRTLLNAMEMVAFQRKVGNMNDMAPYCPICANEFRSWIRLGFHYLESDHGDEVQRILDNYERLALEGVAL
jgi:hypothetical protein